MKFLSLVRVSVILLFRRNRIAFVIFTTVLTIVSLGLVFFFTTIFTSGENYIRNYDRMRTVVATLNQSVSNSSLTDLPEKLENNPVMKLTNIQYDFILHSDIEKENPPHLIAYQNPNEFKSRIIGESITSKQIADCSPVLVCANESVGSASVSKVGDSKLLDGLTLKVIGFYPSYHEYGEIPYTFGLQHFVLQSVSLRMPVDATDDRKEQLGDYVKTVLPECSVTVPKPMTQSVLSHMLLPLAAGIIVGISALVNLLFIFKYMLECSRNDLSVYLVCGCSRLKLSAVFACELFLLYTLCFTAGTLLFVWLRYANAENTIFLGSELRIAHVLAVYAGSLIVIALIMIPSLLKYRRRIDTSGGV
ncbi:FtsX-like permease family protein [Thermocaproicibacter melissae]|uniref:FtsX-like permease family protein n=1 Tax=Thermocaproicibacter melissae TaxID=2966552 RepID=UPI0024B1282E|nr:FtsX-like permease family protein [Thermocaproicibacter melissae]WBY64208.1 hypothetical protein NOG13_00375 [Thermocaproicibacter melissae]